MLVLFKNLSFYLLVPVVIIFFALAVVIGSADAKPVDLMIVDIDRLFTSAPANGTKEVEAL